jgi:TetR/AcrR family transcriptional repressor of mexJK operon
VRRAAEQFIALLRGDIHLRQLLRLDKTPDAAELDIAAKSAVATFLHAFGTRG